MTFALLYPLSQSNFLLFHSLIAIGIALFSSTAFIFIWNSRRFENTYLTIAATSLASFSVFEILHFLTFPGMGIFHGYSENLSAHLWLMSRLLLSVNLLIAPHLSDKRTLPSRVLGIQVLIAAALIYVSFASILPPAYHPQFEPTTFRVFCGWAICVMQTFAMILFLRNRTRFDRGIYHRMTKFFVCSILAEVIFTAASHDSVGFASFAGSVLLLLAAFYFHKATAESCITRPYQLLFRELRASLLEQEALARKLAETLHEREEFLSIASHELKTPITALYTSLELMSREARLHPDTLISSPSHLKKAENALRQARRLNQLVENLLNVGRIQTHQFPFEFGETDLTQIASDVCSRFEADAKNLGIPITLKSTGPIVGWWDSLRVEQALSNLISNAIRYGAASPITVEVGASPDGNSVRLQVQDHGPGIAPEDQATIFERFVRGHPQARNRTGLGVGLYIVKQIAEAHQGKVDLVSQPGQGAKFIVTLPWNRTAGVPEKAVAQGRSALAPETFPSRPASL